MAWFRLNTYVKFMVKKILFKNTKFKYKKCIVSDELKYAKIHALKG